MGKVLSKNILISSKFWRDIILFENMFLKNRNNYRKTKEAGNIKKRYFTEFNVTSDEVCLAIYFFIPHYIYLCSTKYRIFDTSLTIYP